MMQPGDVNTLGTDAGRLRFPRLPSSPGLLILPTIVYVGLVFVWPLARLFMASFTQTANPLAHFQRILTTPLYTEALLRQFQYAGMATIGCLILSYPIAYIMRVGSDRIRLVLTVVVVIPLFVALIVRTFGWMVILGRQGPIARIYELLVGEAVRVLYSSLAVQIGMLAILLPFMVLPIYSVMTSIDARLVRSAQVMGATPVSAFLTVFFPLSLSGVLTGVVLVFIMGVGFYITPDLLGANSGQVYATLLVRSRQTFHAPGFSEAMAVILLAATLLMLLIASRIMPLQRIWGSGPVPIAPIEVGATATAGRRSRRAFSHIGVAVRFRIRLVADRVFWSAIHVVARVPTAVAVIPGLLCVGLAIIILVSPILVAVLSSFGEDMFLSFPPQKLTLRWYQEFTGSYWIDALLTSVKLSLLSTIFTTVLGGLGAFGLVRANYPGKGAIMALLMSPMIIPAAITGIAIYHVFFPVGLVGTTHGLVLAQSIFALPLVTIIIASNLQGFDIRLEQAARVMGASAFEAVRQITLPILRTGIMVAAFFGFLTTFDELTIALFLAGTRIRTLPVRLWEDLHYKLSPMLAVVSVVENILVLAILLGAVLITSLRRSRGASASILPTGGKG